MAINQLPITNETLWLRILGKGETQRQAVRELLELPENNLLRQEIQKIIANWRVITVEQENLTEKDQELIMALSEAYQQWEQKTLQQGQRLGLENLLKVRFGTLDEELSRVIEPLLQLPPEEYTRLCLQLSRGELLARFNSRLD